MSTVPGANLTVAVGHADSLQRDLLSLAIGGGQGMTVTGSHRTGESLLSAVTASAPSVVVMDCHLGDRHGKPIAPRIARTVPGAGLVVLADGGSAALLASHPGGAPWYVVNTSVQPVAALLRAIRIVAARFDMVAPRRPDVGDASRPTGANMSHLTPRQREILALVAQGLTNRAIADLLLLSEKTIENHIASIYDKAEFAGERARVHPRVWIALLYATGRAGSAAHAPDAIDD